MLRWIQGFSPQRLRQRAVKGACSRGIYDNMKTAVEAIFVGKERAYNRRFLQMCGQVGDRKIGQGLNFRV